MDNQQSTKMPKPFDTDPDLNATSTVTNTNPQQFILQEEDGFKPEDDYRQ
ncbi:unnamed protein product, partial [Rotaria magnacalcarata]